MKVQIRGPIHLFTETGTEGGYWAIQDEDHIEKGKGIIPPGSDAWSYKGLYILQNGDRLTILDKDNPVRAVWEGVINLKEYPVFKESTPEGFWIHNEQIGVDRATWSQWFLKEYPAIVEISFSIDQLLRGRGIINNQ